MFKSIPVPVPVPVPLPFSGLAPTIKDDGLDKVTGTSSGGGFGRATTGMEFGMEFGMDEPGTAIGDLPLANDIDMPAFPPEMGRATGVVFARSFSGSVIPTAPIELSAKDGIKPASPAMASSSISPTPANGRREPIPPAGFTSKLDGAEGLDLGDIPVPGDCCMLEAVAIVAAVHPLGLPPTPSLPCDDRLPLCSGIADMSVGTIDGPGRPGTRVIDPAAAIAAGLMPGPAINAFAGETGDLPVLGLLDIPPS